MKETPRRGSFTVVDYGAADGTNSLPLMTACHGKAKLTFSILSSTFCTGLDSEGRHGGARPSLFPKFNFFDAKLGLSCINLKNSH